MSTVDQQLVVACPVAQAAMRLRRFFAEHGNAQGDVARLVLNAQRPDSGLPAIGALERAVVVTIQPHRLPADMTPRFHVQWAPETPGPFPLFAGELFVDYGEDEDSFKLELSGTYAPPLGLLGQGFDAVFGHRIAEATAYELLGRIKASVESAYELDEERKRAVIVERADTPS